MILYLIIYCRDNSELLSMANLLELNDFIDDKLGLNMMIEENGFNLSGGQRQRIVLARTFLRNSKIFLIDEGFSQIDVSLERKILLNIFNKFKNNTIIIVSHRLENIDLYDRVLCIDKGVLNEKVVS